MNINITLGEKNAFKEGSKSLREYAKQLERDANLMTETIAMKLQLQAESNFRQAVYDMIIPEGGGEAVGTTPKVKVHIKRNREFTVVIAEGEEAIFVEFGAGVYYNGGVGSSPHPRGNDLGYTIGSYPTESKKGFNQGTLPVWGFKNEDGELKLTHGTKAQMPMYNAMKTIVSEIDSIARVVFKE